jgi:hypothetical protein
LQAQPQIGERQWPQICGLIDCVYNDNATVRVGFALVFSVVYRRLVGNLLFSFAHWRLARIGQEILQRPEQFGQIIFLCFDGIRTWLWSGKVIEVVYSCDLIRLVSLYQFFQCSALSIQNYLFPGMRCLTASVSVSGLWIAQLFIFPNPKRECYLSEKLVERFMNFGIKQLNF